MIYYRYDGLLSICCRLEYRYDGLLSIYYRYDGLLSIYIVVAMIFSTMVYYRFAVD